MQKNFQEQQKQRQQEMENYKKEMAVLYEKNVQSSINERTASLNTTVETLRQENARLNQEVHSSKNDYIKIIMAFLLALVIGFILAKIL